MASLMRNLGAFFGHIAKGIREDPSKPQTKKEVRRTVEEEDRGNMILRRTTIDEVELKQSESGGDHASQN